MTDRGTNSLRRENQNDSNLGRGRRQAATRGNDSEHQNTVTERKKKQDEMSVRKTKETYDRLTAAVRTCPIFFLSFPLFLSLYFFLSFSFF